jgi:hypothetical protein
LTVQTNLNTNCSAFHSGHPVTPESRSEHKSFWAIAVNVTTLKYLGLHLAQITLARCTLTERTVLGDRPGREMKPRDHSGRLVWCTRSSARSASPPSRSPLSVRQSGVRLECSRILPPFRICCRSRQEVCTAGKPICSVERNGGSTYLAPPLPPISILVFVHGHQNATLSGLALASALCAS